MPEQDIQSYPDQDYAAQDSGLVADPFPGMHSQENASGGHQEGDNTDNQAGAQYAHFQ